VPDPLPISTIKEGGGGDENEDEEDEELNMDSSPC